MNKEYLHPEGRPYTKEEFVNKIKTDDEFAKQWGELGPIYGHGWRKYGQDFRQIPNDTGDKVYHITTTGIDQIANLINDLKTNPDSRRLMVSAWNVGDLDKMVLPPCHYSFQIYTRELSLNERGESFKKTYPNKSVDDFKPNGMEIQSMTHQLSTRYDNANVPKRAISLMWNQRSVDTPLGLPFNIASYALLLQIIAKEVNMIPEELIGNLGDCHIYKNQIDGVKEQLTRTPMKLPNLIISDDINFNGTIDDFLESCNKDSFKLDGYESHPSIKIPLSN